MQKELDFGFLFCRVCHFYAMTDREVLAMPMKRFWLMSDNITRLMAEQDLRTLSVGASSQSSDGFSEYRQQLILEIGTVLRDDPMAAERDQAGFNELRAMAAGQLAA